MSVELEPPNVTTATGQALTAVTPAEARTAR